MTTRWSEPPTPGIRPGMGDHAPNQRWWWRGKGPAGETRSPRFSRSGPARVQDARLWMSCPNPGSLRSASQQVVHVPPVTDHLDVAGVDVEDDPVGPASSGPQGRAGSSELLDPCLGRNSVVRSMQSLIWSLADSGRPFRLRRARRVCDRRGRTLSGQSSPTNQEWPASWKVSHPGGNSIGVGGLLEARRQLAHTLAKRSGSVVISISSSRSSVSSA